MKLKTMINLAQGHNAVTLVRLKLATPRSRVKHHCAPCVRACVYVCVCVCLCDKEPSRPEIDTGYFRRGGLGQ